jgi:hypothetical protein
MMLVRTPQLDAFRLAAEQSFVDEMVRHFRRFSPPLHRTLGDERAERAVRRGIDRAVGYGFTKRGPIRLFLELEWLFGTGFDADPQIPWARELLTDASEADEMFRAGRLEQRCCRYLDEVFGPDGAHADTALRRLEAQAPGWVFTEANWRAEVAGVFEAAFPQKAAATGAEAIERTLDRAEQVAIEPFGPDGVRGRSVLAILMFSFGTDCVNDPYYPWIGATLANPKNDDPRRRAEALERKATWWLKAVNEGRRAAAS